MNRNCHHSSQKTLVKNSHSQSSKLNKTLDSSNHFHPQTPTHFLNVTPQNINVAKSPKNNPSKFNHHFASTTELVSNAFQTKAYVPPHLNSSQVFKCITSECKNWQVRPSSTSKKLNYASMYNALEQKYQKAVPCGSRLKKWTAGSKIKNMVYEDRTRLGYENKFGFGKPYQLYVGEKSGSEADVDYLDDSQRSEQERSGNSSRMVSIGNQSRLKGTQNLVQTQV